MIPPKWTTFQDLPRITCCWNRLRRSWEKWNRMRSVCTCCTWKMI